MRYVFLSLALAACASAPRSNTAPPSYAPIETVTVRASAGEVTRRLLALYAADGITVAANTAGTVTTAPVQSFGLSAGKRASGTVDYFYRATIAGDSVSMVTLALWGRLVTRVASDPASPARENPIASDCATIPQCAPSLERMRQHAAKLREGK